MEKKNSHIDIIAKERRIQSKKARRNIAQYNQMQKRLTEMKERDMYIDFVSSIVRKYKPLSSGNEMQLRVINSIYDHGSRQQLYKLQDSDGTIYYSASKLSIGHGMTVKAINPQKIDDCGKFHTVVTITKSQPNPPRVKKKAKKNKSVISQNAKIQTDKALSTNLIPTSNSTTVRNESDNSIKSVKRKDISYSYIPITPHEVIYSIKHLEAKEFVCFVQTILYDYIKNVTKPVGNLTISRSVIDRQYQRCYCELVDTSLNMYYACINQRAGVGQIVDAAGKVSLFGGLINIVSVTKVLVKSEIDDVSIANLDDEIKKYMPAPKPWEMGTKCNDVILKLSKYENLSLVLKVGTILRNYKPSINGESIYLYVSRFEAGMLAKTFYCEMIDKNGYVYYGYTSMKVYEGMKICVRNPKHVPLANCFAVTIIAEKKEKETKKAESVEKDKKKTGSSGRRNKDYNRPHQFYDPLREEWKAKIKDGRIISCSYSGVCSKCKRMFGEGEGFVVSKCNVFLCDDCRESIRPSNQSKYRDPRAHFISVPMGGQKKK